MPSTDPVSQPRLLDLFCGAGGCARGYQRAGFYVVGVDNRPQPRYAGDEFYEADALDVLRRLLAGVTWQGYRLKDFAGIHASPPCHAYSTVTQRDGAVDRSDYPDLIAEVRGLLLAAELPYVIENVVGAPMRNAIQLCGSSFGLDVRRHRLFESNVPMMAPGCAHGLHTPRFRSLDSRQATLATVVGVHGHLNYPGELALRQAAMGIDWMPNAELTQAIPPAYTEHIGGYLLSEVEARAAATPAATV